MDDASLRDILRKMEQLARNQESLARDMLYIREAVRFRLAGSDVYDDDMPTFTRTFQLDLGADLRGLNWYRCEIGGEMPFRWSGPGLLSTIYLPLERSTALSGRVQVGGFARGVPPTLTVFVDGRNAALESVTESEVIFTIPPTARQRVMTEIGLLTATTKRPAEVDPSSSDERWLGFQLLGLEVFPARAPSGAA